MSTSQTINGNSTDPAAGMNREGKHIQEIVEQIEAMPNPAARALMQECMESVLSFYGDGIARILEVVKRSGIGGQKAYEDLLHDNIVSGLLLIHGLHPHDLATRLRAALDKVRPYMKSHGGNVELLSLENDFARLRLQGSCKTCPSSAVTLELAVRHAIEAACPDLAGFAVEGASEVARHAYTEARWEELPDACSLPENAFLTCQVDGAPLIVCRMAGLLYVYRDRCPACNTPLHAGHFRDGKLVCLEGHVFSVAEAGRSLDDPALHLEPLPLIEEEGAIKVALQGSSPTSVPEPVLS